MLRTLGEGPGGGSGASFFPKDRKNSRVSWNTEIPATNSLTLTSQTVQVGKSRSRPGKAKVTY